MRTLSKRDSISAVVTGLTAGLIAWRILIYLGHPQLHGIDSALLPLLVPILWVAGVQLGYILGAVYRPFIQFGKFACIGFANASVDFGVLYLFIAGTDQTAGSAYSVYKAISFTAATVHSYLWNKYWAFDAHTGSGDRSEAVSFIGVSLASLLVNVVVASVVVLAHPGAVPSKSWAGIAAVIGSAVALIFSFTGFRLFVFKKTR